MSQRARLGDEAASIIIFKYDSTVKRKGIHAIEWLSPFINKSGYVEAKLAYVHRAINFPELKVNASEINRVLDELILSEERCILPTALYLKAVFIEAKKESGFRCYYQKAAFSGSYISIKRLEREYSSGDAEIKYFWSAFSAYSGKFWNGRDYSDGVNDSLLIGDLNFDKQSQLNKFNFMASEGAKKFNECK